VRYLPTSLTLAGFSVIAGLAGCGSDASTPTGTSGASGSPLAGSGPGSAGKPNTPTAGSGSGGAPVVGGAGSGNTSGGSGNPSGGSSNTNGGSSNPSGGSSNTNGGSSSGGSSTGGASKGGTTGAAGGNALAGAPGDVDQMGKSNAKPGAMTNVKFDYLKMGEIRILNNNWGSVAQGCATPMSVFVNADSFGWSFDRGSCDPSGQKPDFPQLEFGIHPFGLGSADATSPNFSSTTLLPLQIKDITSASVTLTDLKIQFEKEGKWDLTFEFWLSSKNPATTQGDAGVYAELMTFWGWEKNRWPELGTQDSGPLIRNSTCTGSACPKAGETVTAGKSYKLTVQDDAWGKWRYFQFRDSAGSTQTPGTFTVDVKKLIDYLVSKGYSKDLWVSRLEVGSEIDDNTKGKVTMRNVEFEINNQKRSPVFGK
jgi:hypothetical protein